MQVMATRDIGRKAKPTRVSPFDVLIAGEDFKSGCKDYEVLRDAESQVREAIDESYVEIMAAHGPQNPVKVIMRRIDGKGDERHPVVVNGRRTVRHAREVMERFKTSILLELNFIPASVSGITLWVLGRVGNHTGIPETDAQRVEYVGLAVAKQVDDATICQVLQIEPTALDAYKFLATHGVIPSVREHLDNGTMSVTAAVFLGKQKVPVQQAALARLLSSGQKFTVANIRKAVSNQGAAKATYAPPRKAINRLLKDEKLCARLDGLNLAPSDVVRFMLGRLDLDKHSPLKQILADLEKK